MPLRPGESFLQGSARVRRQRGGGAAIRSFLPPVALPPPPKVPPVPKVVKQWEKKTPAQKVKEVGFLGAVANDRTVTRFRTEREFARMADVREKVPTLGVARLSPQQRARSELSRLEHLPKSKRPSDYKTRLIETRREARGPSEIPIVGIAKGVAAGFEPLGDYFKRTLAETLSRGRAGRPQTGFAATQLAGDVQAAGVADAPPWAKDAIEMAGKMLVGGAAGGAGTIRHPERVPGQLKDIAFDIVQPIGLGYAAATGQPGAWERLSKQFVQEALKSLDAQYGPNTGWRESFEMSYNQGPIAVLQALAVAAPAARLGAVTGALAKGRTLGEAWRLASLPDDPRVLRLAGGSEAAGRPVEVQWSRSPLIRGAVQRPYDVISRRVPVEKRGVRMIAEPRRAARIEARRMKRANRRLQAEAMNQLREFLSASDQEQLRAIFTRDKPEGLSDEEWIGALQSDVQQMIEGRKIIRDNATPERLAQLQRRVDVLQRKFDREKTRARDTLIGRKLAPLTQEERSLKAKIRSAEARRRPTEELHARLADVQTQLAVAQGEPVGPVADSPARAQMAAVFTEALGPERGGVALQVADQLARGAEPDDPNAWYQRILTQYAEDPETAGVDIATALLQEAGPRASLAARVGMTHIEVQRAFRDGFPVTVLGPDGQPILTGDISFIDGGNRRAAVRDRVSGQEVTVSYDQLTQGEDEAPVFYSQAQRVAAEKLPPKSSPEQLLSLMKKNGIKDAELEWTGMGDWIGALQDSGIKSVTKEEVIEFLANPLNAFDLNETLWVEGEHPHGTRWHPERYPGVTLQDIPGDYKELMVQLPGDRVFASEGHMPGISNPLVQLRFHEVNRQGYNEILIDEMQSDWGAAVRDADYTTRSATTDAEVRQLNERVTRRTVELYERVERELGLHYEAIRGGTNRARYIAEGVTDLRNKLDTDWKRQHGYERYIQPGPGDPLYPAWEEWLQTPERKTIERVYKHANAVARREDELSGRIAKLQRAPANMPYKKSWELLGLKRMVAYAVQNGYDAISWPQGIVPAVRYQKVEPGDYLAPEGGYGTPEDHPQYPSEDDFTRSYTYNETSFSSGGAFGKDPLQERMFGDIVGWQPQWWQEGGPLRLESVPMSETRPVSMTAEELGFPPSPPGSIVDPHIPQVDDLIYLEEGPFPDQFIRIARANEDGTFDVAPSGIESVEIRGDGSDSGGGWTEYEATVTDARGNHYGSGSTAADALRNANFDDVADSEWFDDFETKLDQGWESQLDDDMYQEAVDDFMERWNNGEIEGAEEYGGVFSAQDIAQLDVGGYKGNAYRYDTIFPSVARKEWKRYGVEVEKSGVEGSFTVEGREAPISTVGTIPTWTMRIPEAMKEDVRQGQSFFQAVYPITGGQPVVKGAVELMGNRRFRMTLFGQADITTALHELGHIALYDLDANDLTTIERELAGGRALRDWRRDDHERFARAWERYFLEGYASTTSLRNAFMRIKHWMRQVYNGVVNAGEPITPEVRRVFDKRLGKVDIDEADYRIENPALTRWGVMLSEAKGELERYEARMEIARNKGTQEALRADLDALETQRNEAIGNGDRDKTDQLTEEIRAIEHELDQQDLMNAVSVERREALLNARMGELKKALQKPDSRRYEGAQAAADWLQDEREGILREVFGDQYDAVFAGRREQMSRWLAERGVLDPSQVGPGRGRLPFARRQGLRAAVQRQGVRAMAAPTGRRIRGGGRTSDLNLNVRNEMILWQQGDYQASVEVLFQQYMRALSFAYQTDLRKLLHEIGEPVDARTGPKDGWYLIDPDATPLPRHWESENIDEVEAELGKFLAGLGADDDLHATNLRTFAERWLTQDPSSVKRPDGSYGNVRQVHPTIVNQLMLPYTGNSLWSPVLKTAALANTLARVSLIYSSPGYIPSNILANTVLLFAERGVMGLFDLFDGAMLVMKDRALGRRVRAEMGETMTTSRLRGDTGREFGAIRETERLLASGFSFVADDWIRAAAWSGIARRNGYRGREAQMRLLGGKTEKTRRDRERISEQAVQAMIDFDRLAPWEQRWLRPLVFVWPFIRGATAWPVEYVQAHPFRAGAAVALTAGYGEQAQEELGPVPEYFGSLVPIQTEGAQANIANLASVNPLGAFVDTTTIPMGYLQSAVTGEDIPTFRNLAGFLAPQTDFLMQLVRGQGEFGEATSVRELLQKSAPEFIPLVGLVLDTLDRTRPASQLEQGIIDTLERRTFRFSPQRMNLAILNAQAKERGEAKTVTQKMHEARVSARSAWNQILPGDHMPRVIDDSITAYYVVQENRKLLKEEIKKNQRESWQPTRREPKLTELQEAAIVFDVLQARMPDMARGAPDPRDIFDEYGVEGVKRYRSNIEKVLFMGKRRADTARSKAKQMQRAGIG